MKNIRLKYLQCPFVQHCGKGKTMGAENRLLIDRNSVGKAVYSEIWGNILGVKMFCILIVVAVMRLCYFDCGSCYAMHTMKYCSARKTNELFNMWKYSAWKISDLKTYDVHFAFIKTQNCALEVNFILRILYLNKPGFIK